MHHAEDLPPCPRSCEARTHPKAPREVCDNTVRPYAYRIGKAAMDIDVMREYVHLAQTLNFTKTAAEFYITQPTLSRHIANMEKELGATLILRSTHDAELTEAGEAVAKYLEEVLASYDAMLGDVDRIKRGTTGHLSIGFIYYGGMSYMRDGLAAFCSAHPNVDIEFLSYQPYQIVNDLQSGSIDLGLVFHIEGISEEEYGFTPIHDGKVYAIVSDDDPLASHAIIGFPDLDGRELTLTKVDPWYNNEMIAICERAGIHMIPDRACAQIDLFPQVVSQKHGLLLANGHFPHFPGDELAMIPVQHDPGTLVTGFYWRRDNTNRFVREFLSYWDGRQAERE